MKKTKRKSRRSKRNKTIRYISRGGDPESKSDSMESQSLDQLAELKAAREKESSSSGLSSMIEGAATGTLAKIGDVVGINIDSPKEVEKTLDNLKEMVSNPKNIENAKEIISSAANNAAVYFKAAEPLIAPLTDKVLEVGSKAIEKAGETTTVIVSNAVKEIPGVGLAYSVVQDASKIGEAVSAATNAAAELTTTTADSAVVFKKNLEQLQNEAANATKGLDVSIPNPSDAMAKLGTNIPNPSDAMAKLGSSIPNPSDAMAKLGSSIPNPSDAMAKLGTSIPNPSDAMAKLGTSIPNPSDAMAKLGTSIPNPSDMMSKVGSSMPNTDKITNAMKGGGLNKLSKVKEQIGGRIIDSLDEFSDPINYQTGILKGGNNKTKKSFVGSKHGKTKHVRFSF